LVAAISHFLCRCHTTIVGCVDTHRLALNSSKNLYAQQLCILALGRKGHIAAVQH
jgi:hypothetical protein